MEEKICNQKMKKESLAGQLIEEKLFERCILKEDLMVYGFTNLIQELKERPNMSFTPDDHKLLAELLNEEGEKIWSDSDHIQQLQQQHHQLQQNHQYQHQQHQLK